MNCMSNPVARRDAHTCNARGLARTAVILVLAALLCACAHIPQHNPMAQWVPSANHNERQAILVVLHATEQDSVQESLDTLRSRNSDGEVSAHYLVGRDGALYQLVDDERRAWHAGSGRWGTITDVNSASIGIELDNNGTDPFPAGQIATLLRLLEDLCTRHNIPRTQVIGHADMAPTRKRDPGRLFPWSQLAVAGFGRWPAGELVDPPPGFDPATALRLLGYSTDDYAAAVRAFHLHYRGADYREVEAGTESLDADDARILYALVRQ